MSNTQWNGEPCTARRVTAIVADDGFFPMYWARHLVGTRRKAVEVEYGGETFYLDDEDGSGWNKVTHGGSPHWAHSSLTIEPGSVESRAEAEPDSEGHTITAVDGRDALAFVIIRPGSTEGAVSIEAAAKGLSKPAAAHVLRHVADLWDAESGEASNG